MLACSAAVLAMQWMAGFQSTMKEVRLEELLALGSNSLALRWMQ
jgi:hypothetical protein